MKILLQHYTLMFLWCLQQEVFFNFPECSGKTFSTNILKMFCDNLLKMFNENIATTLYTNVFMMFSVIIFFKFPECSGISFSKHILKMFYDNLNMWNENIAITLYPNVLEKVYSWQILMFSEWYYLRTG